MPTSYKTELVDVDGFRLMVHFAFVKSRVALLCSGGLEIEVERVSRG